MAGTRQQPPRFSQAEAAEIIREATSRMLSAEGERELTREELITMARELGISEEALDQVLAARARKQQTLKQRKRRKGALIGLLAHGMSYSIVIGGLTVLDVLSGPEWWVQWPAVGWGMGLAFHAMGLFLARLGRSETKRDER